MYLRFQMVMTQKRLESSFLHLALANTEAA